MQMLRKPLSVILGLIALAVLLHFVLSSFYPDSWDVDLMWNVLNWFMAFGVIVCLVLIYVHKRSVGADSGANAFICVNVAFYAAAFLAILFFWNWFDDLTAGEDGQGQTHRNFWVVIDALFVIIVAEVSAHLWRDSSQT